MSNLQIALEALEFNFSFTRYSVKFMKNEKTLKLSNS